MAVGDWDRRELCPDGSCTGLIGPEGTCKVCGHVAPNWGDERKRGTVDADDEADEDGDDDDGLAPDPIKPATRVAIGGGEWTARTLCPDGGCVGLIGEDGTCKVCGKTGVAPPSSEADDDAEYDDDESDADSEGEAYEDEDDEGDEEDEADDELAAAADEMAGVASSAEVASAKAIATDVRPNEADDEDDRKLCPDGACIGVIGSDGKCKVCRKEAAA